MLRCMLAAVVLLAACQPAALTLTPPPVARILNYWQPVEDTLTGETQAWQFVGQAGDAVRLRVLGDGISLALHSADGAALDVGADIQVTLPADGIYTVYVSGAGAYQLGLGYTDRPNPADITPTPLPQVVGVPTPTLPYYAALGEVLGAVVSGETRTGAFAGAGEQHIYTFEGQAGQFVNTRLARTSGATDPLLTLYAPSGVALALDDDSGGDRAAALRNIRLPETGVYSLQAGGSGFTGGYELSLFISAAAFAITPTIIPQPTETPVIETPPPTPGVAPNDSRLDDHVPVLGSFTRPGDVFRYTLAAAAGRALTIGATTLPGWNVRPRLEVYNPAGELVAAADSDASGSTLIPAFVPAETGVYLVYITAGSTTGDFALSYGEGSSREDVWRGRIEPDRPTNSTLARPGQREVWTVFLRQDDVISAALGPLAAGFEPALELAAPDGSTAALGSRSGRDALIAAARAPVTGLYTLRVTAANTATGAYTLVWRYVNLAPTPTPLPALLPVMLINDGVPLNTYRFYPFQGQAGQTIRLRAEAASGRSIDPVAALIAPDGTIIAEADDTNDSSTAEIIITLPVDGTYTARVNGYLSAGVFTLTVDVLVW